MSIHHDRVLRLGAALVLGAGVLGAQGLTTTSQSLREPPASTFVERAQQVGMHHLSIAGMDKLGDTPMITWCQSGMAIGDLDGDGLPDVVAAGGAGRNSLFLQQPDGSFVDGTDAAGINAGEYDRCVALGDIDRDGDLDLFLGALDRGANAAPGRSRLYRNDGAAVFTDVTPLTGTVGSGHSTHAKFFDVDLDGWLDLYVAEFHGTDNHLYRNNADLSFTDVTDELGLTIGGSTHAVAIGDVNGDMLPDVVVGQDVVVNNVAAFGNPDDDALFIANGDGTFTDLAVGGRIASVAGIMGIALADVNYDGLVDVYKTDTGQNGPNLLYINHGWPQSGLPFSQQSAIYGIDSQFVVDEGETAPNSDVAIGWAPLFFNADLDPWLDLYVTNGHIPGGNPVEASNPLYQENHVFRGLGPSGAHHFVDKAKAWGLFSEIDDRGAAMGDLDLDGDVDLLVMSPGGRLRFYENRLDRKSQGWLAVEVVHTTSAPGGIGSKVIRVDAEGREHLRLLGSDGPTASNHAVEAVFGLGHEPFSDVIVRFPSGITRTLVDVPANTRLTVTEPLLVEVSETQIPVASGASAATPSFVVTAYAHDSNGDPAPDAECSIEIAGAVPVSATLSLGGGAFERIFRTPSTPTMLDVRVSFDDFTPLVGPRVHVIGDVDVASSLVTVEPAAVRAGSADVVTVTASPRDVLGRSLGAGHAVFFLLDGQPPSAPPVDLGDGRYRAQFAAPAVPGEAVLDVQVDGVFAGGVATVDVADVVSPSATLDTLYEEVPNPLHFLSAHMLRVEFEARDALGRNLGPGVDVGVTLVLDPGSVPAVVPPERIVAQRDGDVLFIIEKPEEEVFGGNAAGIYEVRVDGALVISKPFAF